MFGHERITKAFLGATTAMMIVSGAQAADILLPATGPAGFNWSGFYAGFGVGVGAGVTELGSPLIPGASINGIGGEGFFGEATLGYDHVFGSRFVVGAFVDGQFGNIGPELDVSIPGPGNLDASVENSYGFDAALRAGYLVTPTTLAYVLGGYAWRQFDLETNVGFDTDWDADGYTLGVGMETVVGGNVTLKTEYRYTDLGRVGLLDGFAGPGPLIELDHSSHTFHAGLNYRFGAEGGTAATFESPAYDWTGFFVGLAGGAGAVVHDVALANLPGSVGFNGIGGEGVFGEASLGYDYDFGYFVAGISVDGRYSGISSEVDTGSIGLASINLDAEAGIDVIGRVGAKLNQSTLAYVLGGYSWQNFDLNADGVGTLVDWDSHGFSVGAGLEAAVNPNLSVNLEYRSTQFAAEDFSDLLGAPAGSIEIEPSFHTVRLGAKWKFNSGG